MIRLVSLRSSRVWLGLAAGILATVLLAGCGPNAAVTTPPAATSLTIDSSSAIDTLDPALAYDTVSDRVIENVYDTLYGYGADGKAVPEPHLASSVAVTDGGLTYTFALRAGVTFHSGNAFTCADVAYSIRRVLVTNPPTSAGYILAEPLTGHSANASADPSLTWADIQGSVTCPDPHTAVFHLDHADPAFLAKLSGPYASIVDATWAKAHGEWSGTSSDWMSWAGADLRQGYLHRHASGTGAYRLTSADGTKVDLSAFAAYRGGAPAYDQVSVRTVSDPATIVQDLGDGTADTGDVYSWSDAGSIPGATRYSDPSWSSLSATGMVFDQAIAASSPYVGSGTLDGAGVPLDLFADLETRLCFAYSLDTSNVVSAVFQGHGTDLTMMVPPSLPGYDAGIPRYTYDAGQAATHCQAAQGGALWSNGFTMTLVYDQGNTLRGAALQDVADHLNALRSSFHITVQALPFQDFLAAATAGQLPIAVVGWQADFADASNFTDTFYRSTGYYGSRYGIDDPTLDGLLDQAAAASDATARASFIAQAGLRAHDQALVLPLPQQDPFVVFADGVAGVSYNPVLAGHELWKDLAPAP